MFSGKSEELIRRLRRFVIAQRCVQIFKPIIDTRYLGITKVNSHNGLSMDCIPVAHSNEISKCLDPFTEVIGIDEAQFFDNGLVDECDSLVRKGKLVIVAGLDLDFKADPFGPMPYLLAQAEEVEKLYAVCMVCGEPAMRTQRLIDGEPPHRSDPLIVIGASESYEARCKAHHIVLD